MRVSILSLGAACSAARSDLCVVPYGDDTCTQPAANRSTGQPAAPWPVSGGHCYPPSDGHKFFTRMTCNATGTMISSFVDGGCTRGAPVGAAEFVPSGACVMRMPYPSPAGTMSARFICGARGACTEPPPPSPPSCKDIVALAGTVPELSTFLTAARAGGLDGPDTFPAGTTLRHAEITVFAPTNAAFSALPNGTLDRLLQPENRGELVDILTYHMLYEEALLTELETSSVSTVESNFLSVVVGPAGVRVNTASVVRGDLVACNSVLHLIDRVLIPPSTAL